MMLFCLRKQCDLIWHLYLTWPQISMREDWIRSAPAPIPSGSRAEAEFLKPGNLKLKAKHLKIEYGPIIETLPLIGNYSLIHIQMLFFFLFRLSCERLNIWREPLFPEWLEDSCLLQSCRHTALWHSLLSRLRAMWHRASLIRGQWTSLPLARWKGCKLHFMAANPVANGTLSRVHVVDGVLLAGAGFVLLLPPPVFFSS